MRFGLVFNCTSEREWNRPWDQVYREVLEQCQAAEALGYDHVWLTEHHFMENGYCPSLLTVAAAVAARTTRIKIGTWVLLLPLHNALRVAEDAAVVDAISGGRLILGVGLGYRLEEFNVLGIDRKDRVGRMEEGIEVMRLAWTQDRFSYTGEHYQLQNLTVTPKPVQPGGPPIWMAARGVKPARRAAKFGCSLALAAGGGFEEHAVWERELRLQGRDPRDFQVMNYYDTFVTDDVEATKAELMQAEGPRPEGPTDLRIHYREANDHPRDAEWFKRPEPNAVQRLPIMGNGEHCARELRRRRDRVPATDIVMFPPLGLPFERRVHYMERFAKEVMPRLADD